MKKHSNTEENYLKGIYKFGGDRELVSTNTLSRFLKTTPASVTDMLKKLSEKGLVDYTPYKGVRLSKDGLQVALKIVRKHRLWEVFLVKTLNFSWDRVHDTAEQLEHIDSPELIAALDEFLGFPKYDPHGDPIPSPTGEIQERKTWLLSEMETGTKIKMVGVLMHTPEFLQYLDRIGLNIGTELRVLETIPFDKSLMVGIDKKELIISGEAAINILVMP